MQKHLYGCFKECTLEWFSFDVVDGSSGNGEVETLESGVVANTGEVLAVLVVSTVPESVEVPQWRGGQPEGVAVAGLYERVTPEWLQRVEGLVEKSIDAPKSVEKLHRVVCWYQAARVGFESGSLPRWWVEKEWV